MTETDLQRAIIKAIHQAGYWAFRVNAGRRGSGKIVLAPEGTPDICCVSPSGWLEVKLPGERLNEGQVEWHDRAKRLGVRVETVRSVAEAVRAVQGWRE